MLDVIFLSFFEENAEENWWLLKEKVPHAQRVENISPIGAAHRECANIARTNYFYVVDGDAKILDSFEFDFIPNPKEALRDSSDDVTAFLLPHTIP